MSNLSGISAVRTIMLTFFVSLFIMASSSFADMQSATFSGAKANKGSVAFSKDGGKMVLTLSEDFVVPETPDPHWQVVDSKGNTYLLKKLKIKDNKYNKSITLPPYIKDVAKVQIWCAFAETNLGEAAFKKPMK